MRPCPPHAFAVVIALLAGGCGGGSSSGAPTPTDDGGATPPSGPSSSAGFNGPLNGTLVIERRLFDLATGRYGDEITSPNRDPVDIVSAAPDGRALYDIRQNCRDRPGFATFDCVAVLDPAGNELGLLDPALELSDNAPRVSPDGRFIAVDSTEIHGFQRVLVLGPDGSVLDDAERAGSVGQIDWGPDGAMFYLTDDAVRRATVGDDPSTDTLILRFDASAGFPRRIAVSRDGTRIAVELDSGASAQEQEAAVWLLNADGTDLRPFAAARFFPTVRRPLWSPDGRWLLVSAGGFNDLSGRPPLPGVDFGGGLFALDTSVAAHEIDDFASGSSDTQIRLRSACDSDPAGCGFRALTTVNIWVP